MFIPDCTLVTACFDLSAYHASSRTPEKALKGIDVILKLPIYLIIFGNKPVIDIIKERRHSYGYESMTLFICQEYEDIWSAHLLNKLERTAIIIGQHVMLEPAPNHISFAQINLIS